MSDDGSCPKCGCYYAPRRCGICGQTAPANARMAKLESVVISAKEYIGYLDSEPRITGGPRLGRLRAALAALEVEGK